MTDRTTAAKAEELTRRRARMLPFLALIYFSQQATYLSMTSDTAHRAVSTVKISMWLVLSALLLAALATKGFWFQPREVRDLIDDENTRANRFDAMRMGFLSAMVAAMIIYVLTLFEAVTARDTVHIVLSVGIGVALIRWGLLERRALRDG